MASLLFFARTVDLSIIYKTKRLSFQAFSFVYEILLLVIILELLKELVYTENELGMHFYHKEECSHGQRMDNE